MSTATTQRLTAIGTHCRRPAALLVLFAPVVFLVFLTLLLASTTRTALAGRSAVESAAGSSTAELAAPDASTAEAEARSATWVGRSLVALRPNPRRAVGAAAALFGGILVAASMAGGTYAFLNAQATTPAVTLSSGSLLMTVKYGSGTAGSTTAIPTAPWSTMLPGDVVGQQFTIANIGTVGTTVTVRLSAETAWDIRLAPGTCPSTPLASAPLTTVSATVATVAAGASAIVCVQAGLASGAPASAEATSSALAILLDAKQVAP